MTPVSAMGRVCFLTGLKWSKFRTKLKSRRILLFLLHNAFFFSRFGFHSSSWSMTNYFLSLWGANTSLSLLFLNKSSSENRVFYVSWHMGWGACEAGGRNKESGEWNFRDDKSSPVGQSILVQEYLSPSIVTVRLKAPNKPVWFPV